MESYAGDSSRSVRAESRETKEIFFLPRKFPVKIPFYGLGSGMEMPGPGIVAQSGPDFEHLWKGRLGQVRTGWEEFQEAIKIGEDRLHPGLLEHEL